MRLFYVLLAIIMVVWLAGVEAHIEQPKVESTSPLNRGYFGSSSFYQDLASLGYDVRLGGIGMLERLGDRRVVYMLIAPEKPLSEWEVEKLRRLIEGGRLYLVVADELGVTNNALEQLAKVRIRGSPEVRAGKLGWEYVVRINCNIPHVTPVYSTKVSEVIVEDGGVRVVCTTDNGVTVAIYRDVGESRVVVIGDSSLFANYLYNGYLNLTPTRNLVLAMLNNIGVRAGDTIVLDVEHYEEELLPVTGLMKALIALVGVILKTVREPLEGRLEATMLLLMLISTIVALAYTGLPSRERRKENPLEAERRAYTTRLRERALSEGEKSRRRRS